MKEKFLGVIRKIPFKIQVGLFWASLVVIVSLVAESASLLGADGETLWFLVPPLTGLLFMTSWITVDMSKDYYTTKYKNKNKCANKYKNK